jgi:soluble lytic murein transglycosylase-like protein
MPETAEAMFVADVFDPKQNISGGIRYLRVLANLFEGDMVRIVAAYNAGPDAVRRAGGIPDIAETREYVRRVIRLYFSYKGEA